MKNVNKGYESVISRNVLEYKDNLLENKFLVVIYSKWRYNNDDGYKHHIKIVLNTLFKIDDLIISNDKIVWIVSSKERVLFKQSIWKRVE